jgi:hypothetical protein
MQNAPQPVLTVAILKANHQKNSEPALSYPLPSEPDIELIDDAMDEVLNFLSFITVQVAQKDAVTAKREIQRACARLIELSEAKPKAFSAWLVDTEQKRLLNKFESTTQQ